MMALVATDLRDLIIADMGNVTDGEAADYLTSLGNSIANYVKDNAEVSFVWAGALTSPPFTVDPVVAATGEIISLSISLTPSGATSSTAAILDLQTKLIAGFSLATYNITEEGFVTSPGLLSSSPTIALLALDISGNTQLAAIGQLATQVVDYVTTQVPTAPCSGTHGVYSGAGTVASIS